MPASKSSETPIMPEKPLMLDQSTLTHLLVSDAQMQTSVELLPVLKSERAKTHRISSLKESSEKLDSEEDISPQKLIDLQLREIEREAEIKKQQLLSQFKNGID